MKNRTPCPTCGVPWGGVRLEVIRLRNLLLERTDELDRLRSALSASEAARKEETRRLGAWTEAAVYDRARTHPASEAAHELWARIADKPHWALPILDEVVARAVEAERRAESLAADLATVKETDEDEILWARMQSAEIKALRDGSTAMLKQALGPEMFDRLWGPDLEALGRGVDRLMRDKELAEARVRELELKLRDLLDHPNAARKSAERLLSQVDTTQPAPRPKIVRDLSTPESRAFWASADRIAAEVAKWPPHKRAMLWPYQENAMARETPLPGCGGDNLSDPETTQSGELRLGVEGTIRVLGDLCLSCSRPSCGHDQSRPVLSCPDFSEDPSAPPTAPPAAEGKEPALAFDADGATTGWAVPPDAEGNGGDHR